MNSKFYLGGIVSSLSIFLIHLLIYPYLFNDGLGNVSYYILLSIIYIIVFFLSIYFFNYQKISLEDIEGPISILSITCIIFWFIMMYFSEKESYYFFTENSLRHRIPYWIYFLSLFGFFLVIFIFLKNNRNVKHIFRYFVIVTMSVLQSIVLIAPNIINDRGGNLYHLHAFFNPVYNFVKGLPFDEVIRSIYGHYPIFYYVPVKILNSFGIPLVHATMIVTVLFAFASFLLIYYSINLLLEKDGLFVLAVFAISYISFYYNISGQYYQMIPHRILFVSVSIFILCYFKNSKIPYFLIFTVSVLSLLWNFETGFICTIILILFSLTSEIVIDKIISLKKSILYILYFYLPFVISYVLLNIINVLFGGKILSVFDFIYPLLSNDFEISELALKIPTSFSLFYFEYIFFMTLFAVMLYRIFKKVISKEELIVFFVNLLGLGFFPYYFNRPAFGNIAIVHIPFCIVLFYIYQKLDKTVKKNFDISLQLKKISILLFVSFFVLGAISGIPLTILNRIDSTWNTDTYEYLLEEFRGSIPKDTPVAGVGLTDIYTSLEWDPGIYIMDWADWESSKTIVNYAVEEINKKDSIIIDKASNVEEYLDMDNWLVVYNIADTFKYMINLEGMDKKQALLDYSYYNDFSDVDFIVLCFMNYPYSDLSEEVEMALLMKFEEGMTREECIDYVEAISTYMN